VNLSRVTWLVLGTTMVLVSAVLVAAVFFVDGGSEPFPRGAGPGGSGVANVGSVPVQPAAPEARAGGLRVAAPGAGGPLAAQPAAAGLAASLGGPGSGPSGPPGGPDGPGGRQYSSSLEELNAKLWGGRAPAQGLDARSAGHPK
jgi:hypothetical protein